MTDTGCTQLKPLDPYAVNSANTSVYVAGVKYDDNFKSVVTDGSVIALAGVDFKNCAEQFAVKVCGKGAVEVRLDSVDAKSVALAQFDVETSTAVVTSVEGACGTHDVYLVCGGDFTFDSWQFA